jgi:hypothetical protein
MLRGMRHVDRLGAAMFAGAAIGFVAGALIGFAGTSLDAPIVLPFAGAAIGVFVGALIAGTFGLPAGAERGRRAATARAASHERLRREAHQGWVDGIDLTADAPPRPGRHEP